mgnify:CR=1 FL=1
MKNHYFIPGFLNVLTVSLSLLLTLSSFAQGWYNTDWQYRREISIANTTGSVLADFQVEVNLDSSFDFSKAEANGSDLFFTDSDGITPIPYWIESWDAVGEEAGIWIRVPGIEVNGDSVYMYYGNSSATGIHNMDVPPSGPFANAPSNYIIPSGDPDNGDDLLAEKIVYDDVTGHYWMAFSAIRAGQQVAMAWSDDPSDHNSWTWDGYKMSDAFSPHLLKHGSTWYLFYGDRSSGPPYNISVATSSNVNGPFTFLQTVLTPGGGWEGSRLDQPHVFQRNDGKWVLMYMGDQGAGPDNPTERSGYATADNLLGPYTKYAGNPVLDFGNDGSLDHAGAGNPWVYEFEGVYYIGYTVSHEIPAEGSTPWRTGLVTTSDWVNFEKKGYLLTGVNEFNCFRGAVTLLNNIYILPYTTRSSGSSSYHMAIASQPAQIDIADNPEAVFDFYDGFDGSDLNPNMYSLRNGSFSQASVSGGNLTLTATSAWIRIDARRWCDMDYIQESYGSHPSRNTPGRYCEVGFADYAWNTCRLLDQYSTSSYWRKHAQIAGSPQPILDMAQTSDDSWHTFRVYRQNPGTAGYQVDDNPVETITSNVPTVIIPPFLMSYGDGGQFIVDWTRVRKWAGTDLATTVEGELNVDREDLWTGSQDTEWHNPNNWASGYTATGTVNVTIPVGVPNYPTLTSAGSCDNLTLKSDASGTASLIDNGNLTVNGITVVERYLTNNTWHYVAAPVDDPTASVFTGLYLMEWDEPAGEWTFIVDPAYVLSTDMEGFGVWADNNSTVEFTGALNSGPKSIATTNTFGAPHDNKGFNFAGNPYPSSLDWNVDDGNGWSRTAGNIDLSVYIWNGNVGNYGVYVKDAANGTNDVDNILPPHQGFFVSCSAATGSLGVDDGARVHGNKDILKTGNKDEQALLLKVTGNGYADESMFRISDQATSNFDNNLDGRKYKGLDEAPQLYSLSTDETALSVNSFSETEGYNEIPVYFESGAEGIYSLTVEQLTGFETGEIYLEDTHEENMIELTGNSVYDFTSDPQDDPDRFVLHMNYLVDIEEDPITSSVLIFSRENSICLSTDQQQGQVVIYNMLGQIVDNTRIMSQLTTIPVKETGNYIVKVIHNNRMAIRKVLVK